MHDKIGAKDKISFVLNGEPVDFIETTQKPENNSETPLPNTTQVPDNQPQK